MEDNSKGRYSSYKVDFLGDFAGVSLVLTNPRITQSSAQVTKYCRREFLVETLSDTFRQADLDLAIQRETDAPTLNVMMKAKEALQDFIAKNGETNPNEAIDWAAELDYS